MDNTFNEIRRGDEAARILDSEIYQEAFEKVRENIVNTMATSALGDATTHNRLVIALQVLTQIEKALTDVMQTGRMAKIQLEDKRFRVFG